jgi:hypothetical protein
MPNKKSKSPRDNVYQAKKLDAKWFIDAIKQRQPNLICHDEFNNASSRKLTF